MEQKPVKPEQTPSGNDPFAKAAGGADPFAKAGSSPPKPGPDPFARPAGGADPFAKAGSSPPKPANDPFARPAGGPDPFARPAGGADPFAKAGSSPPRPAADPFAKGAGDGSSRPPASPPPRPESGPAAGAAKGEGAAPAASSGTGEGGDTLGDEVDDIRHGSSPRHRQVSAVLSELAKTARSFLLYDPHNAAIHHFLTTLLQNLLSALEAGSIGVHVQAFELWFQGEVVYLNRDRERSLAFRLYRDGVRGFTLRPGFDWEELTKLLEILSMRYTGVHQHEDDVVTLLWKANFAHLDVVAVEGFVPEDEEEEAIQDRMQRMVELSQEGPKGGGKGGGGDAGATGGGGDAGPGLPDTVGLPPPFLPKRAIPQWVELPDETLEKLRQEVSASSLPQNCVSLIRQLHRQLDDPYEHWQFNEVAHLFNEIRVFLTSEEYLEHLEGLVAMLKGLAAESSPVWDRGRQLAVKELLRACGDDVSVRKLLHSLPVDQRKLDERMGRAILNICLDPLDTVLTVMETEQNATARAAARQLLEQFGADHLGQLEERFKVAGGHLATDLLRVIANIGGEQATAFLTAQCSHPDGDVQDEALKHLEGVQLTGQVGRAVFDAFRRADPARRPRLLSLIAGTQDRRFGDALARFVEEQAGNLELGEAEAIGRVMGKLSKEAGVPRWQGWLEPSGLFKKTLSGPQARQVAGVAALSEVSSDDVEAMLRRCLPLANDTVKPYVGHALSRHRQGRKS